MKYRYPGLIILSKYGSWNFFLILLFTLIDKLYSRVAEYFFFTLKILLKRMIKSERLPIHCHFFRSAYFVVISTPQI